MTPPYSARFRCARSMLATTALVLVAGVLSATTQAASAAPVGSTSVAATSYHHPYSDPHWYPLHVSAKVGCIGDGHGTNNGPGRSQAPCSHDHVGYFGINLNIPRNEGKPAVYAAGAGRVLSAVSSKKCGGSTSAGNYVKIEHGGGRVSLYEHLTKLSVKTGQYVAAGQKIGTAGNTGASCSATSYLDFIVRTDGGGYVNRTQHITTLQACVHGKTQIWPSALKKSYTSWVKVPYLKLTVPTSAGGCGQSAVPATLATPTGVKATVTKNHAKITWPKVKTGVIEFQMQIYHPSTHKWAGPCSPHITRGCTVGYTELASGATSHTVTGLQARHPYRFRVTYHNGAGWSRPSAWVTKTVK